MKKDLLVVINHLTIGGAQKSLITFLNTLDYEKYNVTLYLRKNRVDLLHLVNKNVNVIINDDNTKYYRKPVALLFQLLIFICNILKINSEHLKNKLENYIASQMMKKESKTYFDKKTYDIAIAFSHGNPAWFVSNYISATKKIVRYCESKDQKHDLHERVFQSFNTILCVDDGVAEMLIEAYPEHKDKISIIKKYN